MQKKRNELNEDNSLTHFTLSVLLVFYKREEVEIRHEPYWYNNEQLPSLTSTQLVFFDEFHFQQVSGPPVTSKVKNTTFDFQEKNKGMLMLKMVHMGKTINRKGQLHV